MITDLRLLLSGVRVRVDTGCDVRCMFCDSWHPQQVNLGYQSLLAGLKEAKRHGAISVALSGGEPLSSPCLRMVLKSVNEVGLPAHLTTNGARLSQWARELASCGVTCVHVSLERVLGNTRVSYCNSISPETVIAGISAAKAAGMSVEVNLLVLRGYNYGRSEFVQILKFCEEQHADLCLLDLLYGWNPQLKTLYVSYAEMRTLLASEFGMVEEPISRLGTVQTRHRYGSLSVYLRDYRAVSDAHGCRECADPGSLGLTPPQISTSGTVSICRHKRMHCEDTPESMTACLGAVYSVIDQDGTLAWLRT